MLYRGKQDIALCDERNSKYKEKHKDDVISANGMGTRVFYETTSRDERANLVARKAAFHDIVTEIANEKQTSRSHAGRILSQLLMIPKTIELY